MAEFSHVDGVCFQQYLNWFSQAYPKQLHIIQLDNGRWHIWSELEIPDNVIWFFQPPYSPYAKRSRQAGSRYPLEQVNPIERLWKEIKKRENPLRGLDSGLDAPFCCISIYQKANSYLIMSHFTRTHSHPISNIIFSNFAFLLLLNFISSLSRVINLRRK